MPERKKIFTHKPQINISCSSTSRMWLVCGCAFSCVLQSAFSDGGQSFIIALTAFFSAILTEFILTWRTHGTAKIKDGSAAATAMILTIMLPNQIHPIFAIIGVVFAITVVKYSFGGLGSNWLNPALGGWLFIRFSWPDVFVNAIENASTAISEIVQTTEITTMDNSITEFLNNSVFSISGIQLPSGYIDLLFNKNPGIITDRGLFTLLIGTVVITAVGINRGWIPLVFLTVYGFFIRLAGDLSGIFWNGDILYGIFSGGTVAAAFILAAEPSSSAKRKPGVLVSVVICAILAWFFRYKCMEYSGVFIALALMNCFTPIVRLIEDRLFIFRNSRSNFRENLL